MVKRIRIAQYSLWVFLNTILFPWNVCAQNLIPNPDFEMHTNCPTGVGTGVPLPCIPWVDATLGSSCDFFDECSTSWLVDVPQNLFGFEPAHSGTGYAGAILWQANTEYREYLQAPLLSPLIAGQYYYFSMWVSFADMSCGIDRIGAYFSADQPSPDGDPNNHIAATPQVHYLFGYFNDPNGWTLISGCFLAEGGEQYVTIGNFYSDADTHIDPDCAANPPLISYYYIDDVSLVETSPLDVIDFDLEGPVIACGPYIINPGLSGVVYNWDDGSQDTILLVNESGNYALTVTDGCLSGNDSIDVEIIGTDAPVNIGADDVTICQGDVYSIDLDPEAGDYVWNDGSSGSAIDITTSGLYSVTLNDDGCDMTSDQVMVTVIDPPANFSLGPDAYLCPGDELSFSFDPGLGNFLWQDGTTDSNFSTIDGGTFSLTISNACGNASASVVITELVPPDVSLLSDFYSLCIGDTLTLDLDPAMGNFQWQDGSTDPLYQITASGQYSVSVSNFCGTDEINITVDPAPDPDVNLGPDLLLCESHLPLLLDVSNSAGDFFLWQDGSTSSQYHVNSAGLYSVTVSNECSSVSDQVQISIQNSTVTVNLPPDQLLCQGQTFVLTNSGDDGNYVWQDNSTADSLTISSPGFYALTVSTLCGSGSDTIWIDYLPPVAIPDLGPDISLCPGEQLVLAPTISGVSFLWQDGSTADTLLVNTGGTYFVSVTDQCTSASDTITVSVNNNPPQISLPVQINLCQGDTIILDAGVSGVSYLWSDHSQSSTLTVSSPGSYSLTVSNACGADADTVTVLDAGPLPSVSLGSDIQLCPGDIVSLSPISSAISTWLWSDGSSLPSYSVSGDEMVTVEVSNSCGTSFDTLISTLLPATPPIALGHDTSLCPGNTLLLSINTPNVSIEWSDGSANSSFLIPGPGFYFATISNSCGQNADTITIGSLPPVPALDLGIDQVLCPGETITLDPGLIHVAYLWQDGAITSFYSATQAGTIILTVSNSCGFDSDTLEIIESTDGPQVNLGPDITACDGELITLMPDISGVDFLWQDGSTTANITTAFSGIYILQVSNACGTDADTIQVNLLSPPEPFDLGPDTTICPGESILLLAPSTTSTLQWQDDSHAHSLFADKEQTYSLELTNDCGTTSDELTLSFDHHIPVLNLDAVETWCPGGVLSLDATQLFPVTYQWSTGAHSPTIVVDAPGMYSVDVQAPCSNAHDESEIVQSDNCEAETSFFVPNVFSPNEDGINDVFSFYVNDGLTIQSILTNIFDRWGNLIFSSNTIPVQWNGRFNDKPLNPGVFVYRIAFTYLEGVKERTGLLQGDVTLIR